MNLWKIKSKELSRCSCWNSVNVLHDTTEVWGSTEQFEGEKVLVSRPSQFLDETIHRCQDFMFGSRQDHLKLFQVECLDNVLQEFQNGS